MEDSLNYSPDYEYDILKTNDPDGTKQKKMLQEAYERLCKDKCE